MKKFLVYLLVPVVMVVEVVGIAYRSVMLAWVFYGPRDYWVGCECRDGRWLVFSTHRKAEMRDFFAHEGLGAVAVIRVAHADDPHFADPWLEIVVPVRA